MRWSALRSKRSRRQTRASLPPVLVENLEARLNMAITTPVIVDDGDLAYSEIAAETFTDITNIAGSEVTPNSVSDASGNLYMVYSAGTDGAYHLNYRVRTAGS